MTLDFIRRVGNRLSQWYDHHQGWSRFPVSEWAGFFINEEAPSCARLIYDTQPWLREDEYSFMKRVLSWVIDATVADTRQGTLSEKADLV